MQPVRWSGNVFVSGSYACQYLVGIKISRNFSTYFKPLFYDMRNVATPHNFFFNYLTQNIPILDRKNKNKMVFYSLMTLIFKELVIFIEDRYLLLQLIKNKHYRLFRFCLEQFKNKVIIILKTL